MIIQELRLEPFAGIPNLKAEFRRGLNVVLGPNEAGKSTLVNALKMVLFMPSQYDKRTSDRDISKFMPLTGGDTIRVQLTFSLNGDSYRLSKSWGGKRESTLLLPGGSPLADPKSVQERLQKLLVLKEGTYHSVLFSYQSGLGSTLEAFRSDPGPMHDLTSLLRKGFLETDGVSIEALEQKIEETFKDYFSHWDRDLGRPENNRGIENPYKKEVGRILASFYGMEELYRDFDKAVQHEGQMDRVNQEIQGLSEEISSLTEFIKNNREAVGDARKRAILELEIGGLEKDQERLREISMSWPALEQEIKTKQEKLGDYEKRREELTEELRQAQTHESNKRKLEKWGRVEKKNKELQDALGILKGMRPISKEGYLKLEGMNRELSRLKTSMEAGKIALAMTTEKPMELKVKKDFEKEISCSLVSGQPLELSAGGQIQLDHADWTMKVKSGEMDFDKLSAHFHQVSEDYQELLKDLGVGDFEEGKKAYESYKKQNEVVETLKGQLKESLEGESYEELEKLARLISQEPVYRPVAEIAKEIGEINVKVEETQRDTESKTRKLMEWEKDYESKDQLLDLLVEKRSELKSRKETLNNLKPLPDGITSPEGFVSEFEKKQETLKGKEKDLSEKRITRAELDGSGPDETKEEIEIRWKEAKSHFKQVESEGEAISEILEAFQKIKKSMDEQTLDPWIEELQKVVAPLTLDRYTRIHLKKNTPDGAERPDGLEIPFQALSMGTKVGLGLALRLSMARYFLKDLEGFLILDDPMVDMDPERQRAAAEVIRGFSKNKQVILFTCHPNHAEMLGGHLIRLD